jgi:asparagine synthase (glutamine-hydrolysing)
LSGKEHILGWKNDMCGLAGFFTPNNSFPRNSEDLIQGMIDTLKHRGPNDSGFWIDNQHRVALGHRRLSILDLSIAGHQPMHSKSCRYAIVFNGEVYNFESIRNQINEAVKLEWVGNSDTEVLIEAIELWGLQETLKKVVGVFAIALWDNKERCLHLVRDRMGEKPLYYGLTGNSVIFGSELKALSVHPEFDGKISLHALNLFLRFGFINAPYSIYDNTFKVKPGTIVTFSEDLKSSEIQFWDLDGISVKDDVIKKDFGINNVTDCLEKHLYEAVCLQKIADVPVGAFLSGGVDSSTIVALMQRASSVPVKTFTIGFHDKKFNEAECAKKIATHLGTDHTEIIATSTDALNIIPDLAEIYDEPFADPSQIPTVLVSRITKNFVTVALSGDGGDELFGGYNRYAWTQSILSKTKFLPRFFRGAVGVSIKAIPSPIWGGLHPILQGSIPSHIDENQLAQKINKFTNLIGYEDDYHRLPNWIPLVFIRDIRVRGICFQIYTLE